MLTTAVEESMNRFDELSLQDEATESARSIFRSSRRRWSFALAGVVLPGLSIYGLNLLAERPVRTTVSVVPGNSDESTDVPIMGDNTVSVTEVEAPPAAVPRFPMEKLAGKWILNESIKRAVEMRPDGTASMHVKLDFFGGLLYGSELKMELAWNVDGEVLTHQLLHGEPKANVDRLIRDFGDSRQYRIVELNESVMLLEEFDSAKTRYRWEAAR